MKATYGMITNYEDIETIKTHGTPCEITITRTHGDEIANGYEYEGHKYTIEIDRDGWPIAWERA